jgi:hypothetical protein
MLVKMTRTELIIQLLKVAIGLAFGAYFVWSSLEVLALSAPYTQNAQIAAPLVCPKNSFLRAN